MLIGHWKKIAQFVPPMGKLIEVGWYDQQGTWVVHIAHLSRAGDFYSSTGEHIARPDWWKETTPPPPK